MKVKATQLWPTLQPVDYTVHRILQARSGVGSHSLLQEIFPTQGSNPDLPHCRQILYQLSYQGSSRLLAWVAYSFSRASSWSRNWSSGWVIGWTFYLIWGQGTGLFRSRGSRQQLLWGLVRSRGFCPVTFVQGSTPMTLGFPGSPNGKESTYSAGDTGLIPRSGKSPGGRNGNPLQYSCLVGRLVGCSPTVLGSQSWTWLSD